MVLMDMELTPLEQVFKSRDLKKNRKLLFLFVFIISSSGGAGGGEFNKFVNDFTQ